MTHGGGVRMRISRILPVVAVVVAAVLVSPADGGSAEAYPRQGIANFCTSSIEWEFDGFASFKEKARTGFDWWNGMKDREGNDIAEVAEVDDGTVKVRLVNAPGGDSSLLGKASCGFGPGNQWIEINDDLEGGEVRGVAAHEMGHILKLNHTGDDDSYGGWGDQDELMNTCLSAAAAKKRSMTTDDAASITTRHPVSSIPVELNSNAGFEELGVEGYGWVETGSPIITSSIFGVDAPGGSRYLRFHPSDSTDGLKQTINITEYQHLDLFVSAHYRKSLDVATIGKIYVTVWVKDVDYESDPECDKWESGLKENDRITPPNNFVQEIDWRLTPAFTWDDSNSDWDGEPKYDLPATYPAADVLLKIRSSVERQSNGNVVPVYMDDLILLGS